MRVNKLPSYYPIHGDKQISNINNDLEVFRGKRFYCGNDDITSGICCFNHIIGLPEKNNKEYPIPALFGCNKSN